MKTRRAAKIAECHWGGSCLRMKGPDMPCKGAVRDFTPAIRQMTACCASHPSAFPGVLVCCICNSCDLCCSSMQVGVALQPLIQRATCVPNQSDGSYPDYSSLAAKEHAMTTLGLDLAATGTGTIIIACGPYNCMDEQRIFNAATSNLVFVGRMVLGSKLSDTFMPGAGIHKHRCVQVWALPAAQLNACATWHMPACHTDALRHTEDYVRSPASLCLRQLRVRKELRSLTDREMQLFVTGLATMLSVDTGAGQVG
eukprot:351557-Chlamydomonas_euryale.AAC.21